MNERLTILKQHAGVDYNPDQEGLNLFAELIVRECAVLCDNHGNKVEDERPNKDLSSAAFDCSDIIRDHFGV
jgi:hypothetical protein